MALSINIECINQVPNLDPDFIDRKLRALIASLRRSSNKINISSFSMISSEIQKIIDDPVECGLESTG